MPTIDAGRYGSLTLPQGTQLTLEVGSSAIVERSRGNETPNKIVQPAGERTYGPYLFDQSFRITALSAYVRYSITEENDSIDEPAALEALGYSTYVQQVGVTGINDGSRNDGELLRKANDLRLSAGGKTLILPQQGNVFLKDFIADPSYPGYPYNFSLKIEDDDVNVVVPPGCNVYCTPPGSAGGSNNVAAILLTGPQGGSTLSCKRSRVVGGGRFFHAVPGITGTTPNNNWCAVYASASAEECVISGLYATGFGSDSVAAFDSSQTNRGELSHLKAFNNYLGVAQSSTGINSGDSTTRHKMFDITVRGYYKAGISLAGKNTIGNLFDIDTAGITPLSGTTNYGALSYVGFAENLMLQGVNIKGAGAGVAGRRAINLAANAAAGLRRGKISIDQLIIEDFEGACYINGLQNDLHVSNFELKKVSSGFWKQGSPAGACKDVWLSHGVIDTFDWGLLSGGDPTDVTQGLFHLDDVTFLNVIGSGRAYYNNVAGIIGTARNCRPMPTNGRPLFANNPQMQKGMEFWDSTLNRMIYFSGSGTAWVDGAGASV